MKVPIQIDVQALQETAKRSEHKEAYKVLEKSKNYRIGVGVRLRSPNQPSFFLEVLVYLCTDDTQVDLPLLEKKLNFLKELQGRKYFLSCQNDSSIFGEITIPVVNLEVEYETIELIGKRMFSQTTQLTEE
ncbi:MAG: hypothetical protein ACE5I5_16990 [Candidatus Heimdallarchaeota archaeon]